MLNDEIKKKTKNNYLTQLRLTCQTHDQGHETDITQ
jgi:hypothetical protein